MTPTSFEDMLRADVKRNNSKIGRSWSYVTERSPMFFMDFGLLALFSLFFELLIEPVSPVDMLITCTIGAFIMICAFELALYKD